MVMAFCGNCGAPVDNGKFCSKCGAPISDVSSVSDTMGITNKKSSKIPKMLIGIFAVLAVVIVVALVPRTVDKPCDWCNHRPSMALKTSDGSMAYVCKDCSKECAWCGKKAKKHYENMLGMVVFVCNDCYKEVVNN